MGKMIYKPLESITYREALDIIASGNQDEILVLPLRAGEYIDNWKEAQDICLRLMENKDPMVRANAALGLSYTARTKGVLDKALVKPYLLRELRENKECRWRIVDSLKDINLFLNWNIGRKILSELD